MRILTPLALLGAIVLGFFFFSNKEGVDKSYSLFGIPLVPPIFAQGGGSTLPDPQAGLSSYVQRDPGLIDFTKIVPLFDETVQNGDNYIIGAINIPRSEELDIPLPNYAAIPVRVYVDTDGFIIAYLTEDKLAADMFRWYLSDPPADPLDTVLSDALVAVTTAIGALAPTDASWYHWNYPSATHFSAAAKAGVGNMYMRVPAEAVFSENPSYSWYTKSEGDACCNSSGFLFLEPGGILRGSRGTTRFLIDTLGLLITPGTRYRFEIENGAGGVGNNFLGVAVIYQIP